MRLFKLILVLMLSLTSIKAMSQNKPNIVLVFLDNFGWGEPGFNGGGIVRGAATPNLDTIANEGLRLTKETANKYCNLVLEPAFAFAV
ncbi:hypothetical protein [Alteromonas australica]|uniref:hypothetical protein n=1 Tax=Alteromonas australica TaxID=589873 RepID=UPI003F66F8B8